MATVRMYNVGFGDSFLVTVPRRGRPWRMLVDCGVHMQGAGQREARCQRDQVNRGHQHADVVASRGTDNLVDR